MRRVVKYFLLGAFLFAVLIFSYFFVGTSPMSKEITWGVNFSQKHTQNLRLNWQETYLALLDDLEVKNLKLITHWDLLEPTEGSYHFEDLDWQLKEAEKRGVKTILVIGMKTPRWPECHLPSWVNTMSKEEQQERILKLIYEMVLRYKDSPAIKYWQVENEPFFPFGICPWSDEKFLKKEIESVKSFDNFKRPIIITDSGEGSFWIKTAKYGDIVGTTMYRKVWFDQSGRYVRYPFPPIFYWRKAQLIKELFAKEVIVAEFQAEPWGPRLVYDISLGEQEKTMNPKLFQEYIEYAKKTGLDRFYLWGGEWWFWMKKQGYPEMWEEARKVFGSGKI